MQAKIPTKIAAYTAAVMAIGGSAASAAVVHQTFDKVLTDPSPTDINGNPDAQGNLGTIGGVKFDGTTISFVTTSADGGAILSAVDNYVSGGSAKTSGSMIQAVGGYVQTPWILNQGDVVGEAFTQTTTQLNFPAGSASNVYLGVSTPTNQYGWIHFSYTDGGKSVTIHDAAFQTEPNVPITAAPITPVPETSSVGLIALAGGLTALRRKRKEAAAA